MASPNAGQVSRFCQVAALNATSDEFLRSISEHANTPAVLKSGIQIIGMDTPLALRYAGAADFNLVIPASTHIKHAYRNRLGKFDPAIWQIVWFDHNMSLLCTLAGFPNRYEMQVSFHERER